VFWEPNHSSSTSGLLPSFAGRFEDCSAADVAITYALVVAAQCVRGSIATSSTGTAGSASIAPCTRTTITTGNGDPCRRKKGRSHFCCFRTARHVCF
jgi:hypothetical protein